MNCNPLSSPKFTAVSYIFENTLQVCIFWLYKIEKKHKKYILKILWPLIFKCYRNFGECVKEVKKCNNIFI